MRLVASMPLSPGMLMSITTTSGRRDSILQLRTAPNPAAPGVDLCQRPPQLPTFPAGSGTSLRLSSATPAGELEGVPGSVEYRFLARVRDDYNLDVRVDFARRPGPRALTNAQTVLDQLVLPPWPHHC